MKRSRITLPLLLFAAVGILPLGCGTETGNPDVAVNQEIEQCAVAAFEAMRTGDKWQWRTYAPASLVLNVYRVDGPHALGKQIITRRDTLINGVLYLVIPMEDTILTFDTTYIRKQLVRADTVTDTFTNKTGSDSLVVVYRKAQTDTFKVTDTIVHVDTTLRRDTLYIRDTIHVADAAPFPGTGSWTSGTTRNSGAKVSIQQPSAIDTAAVTITVVSSNQVFMQLHPADSADMTGMREAVDPRNVQVTGHATPAGVNTLALRTAIDNGLRRVAYGPDPASRGSDTALLAVTDYRYTGTAESSLVSYRITRGAADATGAGDRLVSLDKSVVYRSGALARVDMRILFERPVAKGQSPSRAYIGFVATLAGGSTGVMARGEINVADGWLLGAYEKGGKQYEVFVDSSGRAMDFDVNVYGPSGPRIK